MAASSIPAACTNLTAILAAAMSGWTVVDGPPIGDAGLENARRVWVGCGTTEVAASARDDDLEMGAEVERYSLECLLEYWTGDDSVPAARTAAFAGFALAEAAVRANRKLSGAVWDCRISGKSYLPQPTQSGLLVSIPFTVAVEAEL